MKIAKKWLCIILALTLFGCLCACTEDKPNVTEQSADSSDTASKESSAAESDEATSLAEASSTDAESATVSEEAESSDVTYEISSVDSSEPSSSADESQTTDSSAPDNSQTPDSSAPDASSEAPSDESSKEPDESSAEEKVLYMTIGNNTASLNGKEDSCYSWVATEDATLALQFSGASKTGWAYQVDNLTAGVEFTKKGSSKDGSDANVYLSVFKGDKIQVTVNTATGAAGSVSFKASLLDAWGTENSPMSIDVGDTNYLRVPAGKTVYFCGRTQNTTMEIEGESGSTFEFNGESYQLKNGKLTVDMPKSEGGRAEVLSFAITNNSKRTQVYSVTCDFPRGTADNPASVKLGSNSVQIESGNQYGYVYEWTATANGTVTITMTGSNWHYEILNINTMVQEQSNSGEDEPANEATLTVKKGQVVRITINTGDGKSAKVTFNFSFA